jgi:CHRD domain-containing protein
MRRRVMTVLLATAFAGACSESSRPPTQPETFTVPVMVTTAKNDGTPENHRTHMSGDNEVFTPAVPGGPTPADSQGQGQAIFQLSRDGNSLDFKVIASNIDNITQAHIHCGVPGANGPIVVWLYPSVTATAALPGGAGRHDGVLADGTVVSGATLNVRPTPVPTPPACPGGVQTFADVLTQIRAGNAYVNVHTNDGVGPAQNTGPGDFPGGEIRGQIR